MFFVHVIEHFSRSYLKINYNTCGLAETIKWTEKWTGKYENHWLQRHKRIAEVHFWPHDLIFYLCLQFSLVVFFDNRPLMFYCNIHCFIVSFLNVQCFTMKENERKLQDHFENSHFIFIQATEYFPHVLKVSKKIQCSFTYFMEYLNK